MSAQLIGSWSIPCGTFLPLSINSIGDNSKTVLIVAGEDRMFTLVIKNLLQTVRSAAPPHKVSCIKLDALLGSLEETVVTASNTVCRMSTGELIVFGSVREIVTVEVTGSVKAICSSTDGRNLLMIRLINGTTLQLDFMEDVSGGQLTNCLKSFDLSWEKSGFETSRMSQVHKLRTICVGKGNLKFFKRFLNCNDLQDEAELTLFTMDNGLFWLKTVEDSYEIVTVKLFPSVILDFQFSDSTCCFSILLANGLLNINSISEDVENLLIQQQNLHLGCTIEAHQIIPEISTLIYSDGSQLKQVRYFYSELNKTIEHVSKQFPIPGVTGITYLSHAEMAICVTENRLFYSVPIVPLPNDQTEMHQDDYFEITTDIISQAKQMTCFLTDEVNLGQQVSRAIEREREQVSMLTCAMNQNLYINLVSADVAFHSQFPSRSCNTILLGNLSNESSLFAEITINLQNGLKSTISHQDSWLLKISIDTAIVQIPLSMINCSPDNKPRLIIPICEQTFKHQGFPRIEISIAAVVSHGQDRLHLSIPLNIKRDENYARLFLASPCKASSLTGDSNFRFVVHSLIQKNEKRDIHCLPIVECMSKALKNVDNLTDLLAAMGIAKHNVHESANKVYLSMGNQSCELEQNERKEFRFRSDSPGLLLLLKLLCSRSVEQRARKNLDDIKVTRLELLQCENNHQKMLSVYRQMRTSASTW